MPKKLPLAEFKKIYSKVPRICVDLVIRDTSGAVLLTKRAIEPAKGLWHLPGGTIIYGEALKDAANRVAREELGVTIKQGQFIGVVEFLSPKRTAGGHALAYELTAEILKGPIKLDYQASEYAYFKKIPEDTILEQREFLKELIEKN